MAKMGFPKKGGMGLKPPKPGKGYENSARDRKEDSRGSKKGSKGKGVRQGGGN